MFGETADGVADKGPDALVSHYVKIDSLGWTPTGLPGIDQKILFQDQARGTTALVRFQPGAEVPLHRHQDVEQSYVLEGSIEDADGVCDAGDFVWRPSGSVHHLKSPHGALLIAMIGKRNVFL